MSICIDLVNAPKYADSVKVYKDGKVSVYPCGDKKFSEISAAWEAMLAPAHAMPAYGVSLDRETRKEINSGLWAEFVFSQTYCADEMTFERLLFKIEKSYQGFNIIRYNSKYGYDGRCFYFDLMGNDMSAFYDVVAD